ncbi:Acetylornithine deacetylase [Sulfitobacter noctilucae]|uniref:acetylornithine deacetylase n=1 Tax=Sulfitobacter noctilucae TaxID=1342302 RepID=UPI0004682FA1|nr:acetylornithine deacetylase [Sulfitobacter noctilucae]KIN70424.1 Acetylornithine deacetylase [Sulfitobacter noctilucae]
MHVTDILSELIAIPDLPGQSNAAMGACIGKHLDNAGATVTLLPGPEGDRGNIFATLGPADERGYLLSGHMDVVPVEGQDWTSDPFSLTARDGKLYGRGTSDMKGFLASMLATAYALKDKPLRQPLHFAFSYDEEIGCRGVPHMITEMPRLCAPPLGCIIGEPSDMHPVLSHKGKRAVSFTFKGRAAHSSTPDAGLNALYPAADLALFVRGLNLELAQSGAKDDRFDPPHSTVVASVITGGTAVNIIPDGCTVQIECRAVPGQDADAIIDRVLQFARAAQRSGAADAVEVTDLSSYPALTPPDDPALESMMSELTGHPVQQAVSFGTEAGLFQAAGHAALICGPGSMSRAHRADEYITQSELDACCKVLGLLADQLRP